MAYDYLDLASTPSVRAAQEANGSGDFWAHFEGDRSSDRFTGGEAAFIAERDSVYVATVSESGWPYMQHRGGPPGFIRVLDEKTLAIPDFRGNRQYISTGNLAADDRAALFLMDYPNRRRLKVYAHVEAKDLCADAELAASLRCPATGRGSSAGSSSISWRSTGTVRNISRRDSARPSLPLRSRLSGRGLRRSKPKIRCCAASWARRAIAGLIHRPHPEGRVEHTASRRMIRMVERSRRLERPSRRAFGAP